MARKRKRKTELLELLEEMIKKRGERPSRERHWEDARTALGKARWYCMERDVTEEIRTMRRHLAAAGLTLKHIGTRESEIAELLARSAGRTHQSVNFARGYLRATREAVARNDERAARITLSQLESKISGAGLNLTDVGTTQEELDAWRRQYPSKRRRTKS